jgi:hypothetical protein
MNRTSLKLGTLRNVHVSEVSRVAANRGKQAFLAPEIEIVPANERPPMMRTTSMENGITEGTVLTNENRIILRLSFLKHMGGRKARSVCFICGDYQASSERGFDSQI